MRKVKSTDPVPYASDDDATVARALAILDARVKRDVTFTSPETVRQWLTVRAAPLQREVFAVLFLDAQHGLIECVDLFSGTLNQASVYPREIVRAALQRNAAAVILTHNHPSGVPEPSRADEFLTQTLKSALALVDIRVLDHIVTGGGRAVSFAERGLL